MPKHALTETKARAVCWMNTAYCKPRVQAGTLAGADCREEMTKLQKMGELLQLDFAASEYLFAQYALNNVLGDIYRQLAAAVDADLSILED